MDLSLMNMRDLSSSVHIFHIHYLIKSIRTSLCSSKLKPRCHYDCTYQYKMRQKAVCCSLLRSTSKMGKSVELSDFECWLIIVCNIIKKSVRDTATLLNLPKSMVGDVTVKWKREGTTTMKPRRGRPCLMTDRDHWVLKKVVHKTHQTSSETITCELHSAMNCPASTMTVHRELRGWAAAHKPNISPVNAKCHLKWCKERHHWTVDSRKRVIWSDESHYTMWRSDMRVWVWQIPGERYLRACVVPTEIFRGWH
jgi:transposase